MFADVCELLCWHFAETYIDIFTGYIDWGFKLSSRPAFSYKARGGPYSYVDDSDMERNVERPSGISGDFLDNRRIILKLDEYMNLSDGIDDELSREEVIQALLFTNQQRHIFAPKVAELFDESKYSFPTMFTYLAERAQVETPNFFGQSSEYSEFKKFLNSNSSKYKTTSYFIDVLSFVYEWIQVRRLGIIYYWNMCSYASAYNHSNPVCDPYVFPFNGCRVLVNNWSKYKIANDSRNKIEKIFISIENKFKGKVHKLKYENLDKQMQELEEMFVGPYDHSLDNYMKQLSSCMLLPDDNSAEAEDLHLIDAWLDMFDAFYPKYEELLAWYKSEHG